MTGLWVVYSEWDSIIYNYEGFDICLGLPWTVLGYPILSEEQPQPLLISKRGEAECMTPFDGEEAGLMMSGTAAYGS